LICTEHESGTKFIKHKSSILLSNANVCIEALVKFSVQLVHGIMQGWLNLQHMHWKLN